VTGPSGFFIGWVTVVFVTLGLAGWQLAEWLRWRSINPAQTQALIYQHLKAGAKRLAVPQQEGDTPYEFAQALRAGLARRQVTAPQQQQIQRLIDLYVLTSYSQRPATQAEQGEAIRLWNNVRWVLWWAGWRSPRRV
jgi:hypothetical protein